MIANYFTDIFWQTATALVGLIVPICVMLILIGLIKKFIVGGS